MINGALFSQSPAQANVNAAPSPATASAATPATAATGPSGLGNIRGKSPDRTQGDLAHQYLAWSAGGKSFSVGHALGALTGLFGRGFRMAGDKLQGTQNQKWDSDASRADQAKHVGGRVLKGIGNILGAATDFAFGTVAAAERKISDLAGFALRLAGAGLLGIGASVAYGVGKLAGNTSLGEAGLELAKDLVVNSPMLTRGHQQQVTVDVARNFQVDVERVRLSPDDVPPRDKFKLSEFPQAVQDRFIVDENGDADPLTGMGGRPQVRSGSYTDVRVDPTWAKDENGNKVLYLEFHGTRTGMNVKSDLAQGLGIRDGAFRDAKDITRMFVEEYSRKNPPVEVRLVGHSMGGALAQYAGISAGNGMRVTCFNSAGLHPMTLEKLGAARINRSNVTHFNNSNDWLSQRVEARFSPLVGVQVGTRYVIPNDGNPHRQLVPSKHDRSVMVDEPSLNSSHSTLPAERLFESLIAADDAIPAPPPPPAAPERTGAATPAPNPSDGPLRASGLGVAREIRDGGSRFDQQAISAERREARLNDGLRQLKSELDLARRMPRNSPEARLAQAAEMDRVTSVIAERAGNLTAKQFLAAFVPPGSSLQTSGELIMQMPLNSPIRQQFETHCNLTNVTGLVENNLSFVRALDQNQAMTKDVLTNLYARFIVLSADSRVNFSSGEYREALTAYRALGDDPTPDACAWALTGLRTTVAQNEIGADLLSRFLSHMRSQESDPYTPEQCAQEARRFDADALKPASAEALRMMETELGKAR